MHATDLGFLFILFLAIFFDAVDIILELTAILIIPKLLGMLLDVLTLVVIGGWIYVKTGKLERAKEGQMRPRGPGSRKGQRVFLTVLRRVGLTFLAELIVFVGLLPLWTIAVISTLRQK